MIIVIVIQAFLKPESVCFVFLPEWRILPMLEEINVGVLLETSAIETMSPAHFLDLPELVLNVGILGAQETTGSVDVE